MAEPVAWMTDTKELRETLRAYGGNNTLDYRHRAASAIERLEAERDEARQRRDDADNALVDKYRSPGTGVFSFPGDVAAIVQRLDAAEAQRDQLAEALRIAEAVLRNHPTPFSTTDGGAIPLTSASEAAERARAALDHVEG